MDAFLCDKPAYVCYRLVEGMLVALYFFPPIQTILELLIALAVFFAGPQVLAGVESTQVRSIWLLGALHDK
jgi:hypothetical protein